jgi:hypothetical protein
MNKIKLLLILLTMILNTTCFAQFAGGTGTYEDPYLIQTAEQLDQIRNYMTSSFRQDADIDLGVPPWNENGGWPAIGYYDPWNNSTSFRGNYNGGGYKIENLYRDTLSTTWAGLFGSTRGCILENINLINFNIMATGGTLGGLTSISYNDSWSNINVEGSIKGSSQMGLISSFFQGYNIKNCQAKGELKSTSSGFVGGIVGMCNADSIMNCYAEVKIASHAYMTGGLIGQDIDTGYIKDCYTKAYITVTEGYTFGGFIGKTSAENRDKFILNCYSEGSVYSDYLNTGNRAGGFIGSTGGYPYFVNIDNCYSKASSAANDMSGGFVGRAYDSTNITNCYSAGSVNGNTNAGGFIGFIEYPESVFVTNCYWDKETSGIDSSAAGVGRTTAEMTVPVYGSNTYVGWDFGNVWADDIYNLNEGYPRLEWACGIEDNDDAFVAEDRGFDLYQNYPNPFNPVTKIKFALAKTADVKLSVYNINGQKVAKLLNEKMKSGFHSVFFDGEILNSGVYYYVLEVEGITQSRRMLLIK